MKYLFGVSKKKHILEVQELFVMSVVNAQCYLCSFQSCDETHRYGVGGG